MTSTDIILSGLSQDHILCIVSNLLLTYACLHFRNVSTWVIHITRNMLISESLFFFPCDTGIKVFFAANGTPEHCLNMCPEKESMATATLPRSECQLLPLFSEPQVSPL